MSRTWTLLGPDRKPYTSELRGTLGGHSRSRVYGRLDCPAAQRAIARGGYVIHRVFFLDQAAALAAGYRPCGAPNDTLTTSFTSGLPEESKGSGASSLNIKEYKGQNAAPLEIKAK